MHFLAFTRFSVAYAIPRSVTQHSTIITQVILHITIYQGPTNTYVPNLTGILILNLNMKDVYVFFFLI